MKRIVLIGLIFLFINLDNISACTTFFLEKNGQMVFGKNYDWMTGTGMINTNLRGLDKSSLPIDGSSIIKWKSKYGSTTFNQFGKEFPNGGMNEKGLVIELMWLSDSEFPDKDKRPGLSVLQWIQYQLDNCSSVEDVIVSDKRVRIVSLGAPQHYLVADAKGAVATIEFINGKMVVHRSSKLPFPVLTNNTYESSLYSLKSNTSKRNNSFERFSNVCKMWQQYKQTNIERPIVTYAFDMLKKASQKDFTQWSIVYDITNKIVYFKTASNQQQRSIAIGAFNYEPANVPLAYSLNDKSVGAINNKFTAYTDQRNRNSLFSAFKESAKRISIQLGLQKAIADFANSIKQLKM